jgi:hypothetical protein
MKFRILISIFELLTFFSISDVYSCTTAIVSAKATPDARPLLLKHRDSDFEQNKLIFFTDGKYRYIGLVNAQDSSGKEVWAGCNSTGFAIMNAAVYNLNRGDSTKLTDQEGVIMKRALQTCTCLADFENLLHDLPKPLGVEANFGVIDTQGGAAYYETGNYTFTKFDANDPKVAPLGYIIRTNYAFSGQPDSGHGYIRYATAEDLLYQASAMNNLTEEFLLRNLSRCLKHSLTATDLWASLPVDEQQPQFVFFRDYIPRYSSTSTVVIQGIRGSENPGLTTMWTILGFPLCSVVVPTWIAGGSPLPGLVTADHAGSAPLCTMSLKLKRLCFPIKRDNGDSYLNLSALINRQQTGVMQKLYPVESAIIAETHRLMEAWRQESAPSKKIQRYYNWLDEKIRNEYKTLFNISN